MRLLACLLLLSLPLPAPAAPSLATEIAQKARSGGTVTISGSGVVRNFAASFSIPRGKTLVLRSPQGAVLDGGGAEYGIRIGSGGRFVLDGVTLQNYSKNTIRATLCESVTLNRCVFRRTGQAAVLTGKCKAVRVEGCEFSESQSHGLYVSEGGSSVVIRGNVIRDCGAIGIHVNACRYRAQNVSVLSNKIMDCGNSAIQLAAVTGAVIAENSFARCRQGVTVWNDSRASCRCIRIDCRNQAGPFNVHRSSVAVLLPPTASRTATLARERRPAR